MIQKVRISWKKLGKPCYNSYISRLYAHDSRLIRTQAATLQNALCPSAVIPHR